jgi:uncharacterized protein DUF5996
MTLPDLHLTDWRATKDTLHLYSQIVGKIRLATTTPRNHWWNVPLYVDVRGLTTRRLHHRQTTFEITIDFVDHALILRTADGRTKSFELRGGLPVADFDTRLHTMLADLDIDVEIKEEPFGVPMTTPFPQDIEHASWDREAIERFGRILDWSDSVFEEFSGWFNGKTSPVHLFWHSLDLARHPVLGPTRRTTGRRSRDARGLLARAHLVRILGRRRHHRRRRLLLLHRPGARGTSRPATVRGRLDRVRLRLAGGAPLRGSAQRELPQNNTACVLPKRLRGWRSPLRLGYHQLRVDLVPHPEPAPAASRKRCRRLRPDQRATLRSELSRAQPSPANPKVRRT